MKQNFPNKEGKTILLKMVQVIQDNKGYLGEVDGVIGDGDHGANMNKGFTLFAKTYENEKYSFTEGLEHLGMVLLNGIGGSMGPIYGTIFMAMAEAGESLELIGLDDFCVMLEKAREELFAIVDARVGDKTLVDSLVPGLEALCQAAKEGKDFQTALSLMCQASEKGMEHTRELTAKYGRSSRLGERSRGVYDAGAVSCNLLLKAMAEGITSLL